ncbi:MAG: glycosylase [Chlorobi bacterium]|nr:glycosylase [Chlorobiota bacterium]
MRKLLYLLSVLTVVLWNCSPHSDSDFPSALVHFKPYKGNPVFSGTGRNTWDKQIRERGFILFDEGIYKMWYTGYNEDSIKTRYLGYATSPDGLKWSRYPGNPIYTKHWTEDVQVIKYNNRYYMFAEGLHDIAFLMESEDGILWTKTGDLDIRQTNGEPISPGAYGTPSVWIEDGIWYLFYERHDEAIWLATSTNLKTWTNVQDEPVIKRGPESYDKHAVAVDQIIKYQDKFYAYYHATAFDPWRDWTTCVAVSGDLIHWKKYEKNPIISGNRSSGIIVQHDTVFRLYTMHPQIEVFFSSE